MSRRGCHGLNLFIALLTFAGAARGQESAPMIVDLSKLPPNLESDFTTWRTGEGEAAQWALIADPTATDGRAIAQVSEFPAGWTLLGRWHDMTGRTGVLIIESNDLAAVHRWIGKWNPYLDVDLTPVVDDEESAAIARQIVADNNA